MTSSTCQVIHGDCLQQLRELPDNSVDAVVTDPPYGLEFMGKEWDAFKPASARIRRPSERDQQPDAAHNATTFLARRNMPDAIVAGHPFQQWCEQWATECLRVLKPGGHLLAFGGTRTYHRLAVGVEDAGFEIRDSITWLYGSGFPKSLDVSKAIDKAAGATREVVGVRPQFPDGTRGARARPNASPEVYGDRLGLPGEIPVTAPATPDAQQWQGWGTALKPASEPIVVARKPLTGTVAANVLAHGTGALNIDGCRVGATVETWPKSRARPNNSRDMHHNYTDGGSHTAATGDAPAGRWPSNVVLSHTPDCVETGTRRVRGSNGVRGSDEGNAMYGGGRGMRRPSTGQDVGYAAADGMKTVPAFDCAAGCLVAELDEQSAGSRSSKPSRTGSPGLPPAGGVYADGAGVGGGRVPDRDDLGGGASRFFPTFRYQAKAPSAERPRVDGSPAHPTVKPLALMRWLVRLVTPPSGTVLEPFAGSGTTVEACLLEGFNVVAIEREADYLPLIHARIERARNTPQKPPPPPSLFDGEDAA